MCQHSSIIRFLLGLFFLLPTLYGIAQSPSYSHFTATDGLAGNTIYCSTLDEHGYLWFGTDRGLSRFDGHYFEYFGIEQGLPDPEVLDLYPDHTGRLWISCFRKNLIYRWQGKVYTEKNDPLLQKIQFSSSIINMYEDREKRFWIAGKANHFYAMKQAELSRITPHQFVNRIFEIGTQRFAIADNEIALLQPDGTLSGYVPTSENARQAIKNVSNLVVFGDNLLVSGKKLYLFSYQNGNLMLQDSSPVTGKLYRDKRGAIWLASSDKGCYRFAQNSQKIGPMEQFLPEKRVNTIVEDNQGGIWLGTIGDGLYYFIPGQAVSVGTQDPLVNPNFTSIRSLPNGTIIAGNSFSQVYAWTSFNQKVILQNHPTPNQCRSIVASPDHRLVIGTDHFISFIENGKIRKEDNIKGIKVMHRQGDSLFVGTASSLYRIFNQQNFHIKHVSRTTALCMDHQGYLWTGGINTLHCQAQGYTVNWADKFNLLQSRILCLERGPDDHIWLASTIHGLLKVRVDRGEIIGITPSQHYFSEQFLIQSMVFDTSRKNLWLSTNNGIYRLDAQNRVRYFGKNEGLASLEVNALTIRNDTIWAATTQGISIIPVTPDHDYSRYRVEPVFAAYWDNGQQVNLGLRDSAHPIIVFPNVAQLASIKFSAVDYANRLGPDYHCTVINQLPRWNEITVRNFIDFLYGLFNMNPPIQLMANNGLLELGLHLPAGKYQIHCSARPNGSIEPLQATTVIVQKKPFWYQTLWFWSLLLTSAGLGIWLYWKNLQKIKRIQTQLTEIRLQAIQAQINPHFIGNSIQAIQQFFYPPDAVKASTYISALSRLLRRTIECTDQQFALMGDEIQFNRDYLELVKLRLGPRFNYEIALDKNIPDSHPFPTMLLQPLIENATTHGLSENSPTHVRIVFGRVADTITCHIYDNGPGLTATQQRQSNNAAQHESKGLKLVKRKVNTLNALYPCQIDFFITDDLLKNGQPAGTVATIRFSTESNTHHYLLNYGKH